jgi:hypothetical protein
MKLSRGWLVMVYLRTTAATFRSLSPAKSGFRQLAFSANSQLAIIPCRMRGDHGSDEVAFEPKIILRFNDQAVWECRFPATVFRKRSSKLFRRRRRDYPRLRLYPPAFFVPLLSLGEVTTAFAVS